MPDSPSIGRALAALRAARGWTQAELAEASGVDKARISRYERGAAEPSPRTLRALLEGFEITLPELRHLMDVLGRLIEGEGRPAPGTGWLPEDLARLAPALLGPGGGEGGAGPEEDGGSEAGRDPEVERLARAAGRLAAGLVRLHFRRLKGGS